MVALRPSPRTASAVYDSNGREYLASVVGWSRNELDAWLSSGSVQHHLLLWYSLCYIGQRRFNDGVDWINCGYFYEPSDLEEDLLLLCFGEGNAEDIEEKEIKGEYTNEKACTHEWTTQEVWARTAWRIVQANRGPGQAFEKVVVQHPAMAYGFAIDILCLAFHSLAFRGSESVWDDILSRSSKARSSLSSAGLESGDDSDVPIEIILDREPEAMEEEELETEACSAEESELSTIVDDDDEYQVPETPKTLGTPKTPKTPPSQRMDMVSPKAPRQTRQSRSVYLGDEKAHRVFEWMAAVQDDPMALDLRDEKGVPITGYRVAA